MKNIDLLFFDNNNYQHTDAGRVNDLYIADMGIEYIKNLQGFFSSETYEIFINTISAPLTNAEKIKERQNILKDFLEFPGIAQRMKALCNENRENKCQSHNNESDPKERLIEFQTILYRSMDIAHELAAQLRYRDFCSKSLKDLRSQLDCREKTERIKARINTIVELCVNDNIALSVEYGSAFKFRGANIYSDPGKNKNNGNKKDAKDNIILNFFKNKIPKQKETGGDFYYNENFIIELEVEGEKGILPLIAPYAASLIAELNRHILSFCASLSRQLTFYIACMEIVKFMENNNIKSVYPGFHAAGIKKGIKAENLYDFGLMLPKTGENMSGFDFITPNCFDGCGNAVYLISGANRGGKTAFLKSIGIAQLFAQAGLKVPAEEYLCPVFNNFFSHFPKDEDEDLNFGKLAEELTRIKKDMPMITDNALVLLNESFATTTETEGFEIAADILKALSETSPNILFVTHNYQLLKKRHELGKLLANETKIKSLIVAEGKSATDRTYKIIEGEPQENINAVGFLDNYLI